MMLKVFTLQKIFLAVEFLTVNLQTISQKLIKLSSFAQIFQLLSF